MALSYQSVGIVCFLFLLLCIDHKVFLKLQGFIDDFPLDVFLEHLNYDDERCENGEKTHARITAMVYVLCF